MPATPLDPDDPRFWVDDGSGSEIPPDGKPISALPEPQTEVEGLEILPLEVESDEGRCPWCSKPLDDHRGWLGFLPSSKRPPKLRCAKAS